MDVPHIRALAQEKHEERCELFDGNEVYEKSVTEIADDALRSGGTL